MRFSYRFFVAPLVLSLASSCVLDWSKKKGKSTDEDGGGNGPSEPTDGGTDAGPKPEPCDLVSCGPNQRCVEVADAAECICDDGFDLDQDGICAPLSPCVPSPCTNRARCSVDGADFVCTCQTGWAGKRCELGDNPALSDLTVSTGTLSPAFSTDTLTYKLVLGLGQGIVNITPAAVLPTGVELVSVDGVSIQSGATSPALAGEPLPLNQTREVKVFVRSQTGKERTYTINVMRSLIQHAYLKASDSVADDELGAAGELYRYFTYDEGASSISDRRPVEEARSDPSGYLNAALAYDGTTLALGAPQHEWRSAADVTARLGAVYAFERTGSTWRFAQKLTQLDAKPAVSGSLNSDSANDLDFGVEFGTSAALFGDTLAIGAPYEKREFTEDSITKEEGGVLYLHKRSSTGFERAGEIIHREDSVGRFFVGQSVAMDSTWLISGQSFLTMVSDGKAARVQVYRRANETFELAQSLVPPEAFTSLAVSKGHETGNGAVQYYSSRMPYVSSLFGYQIALDGSTLAVAQPFTGFHPDRSDDPGLSGAVHIYEYAPESDAWVAIQTLWPDADVDHAAFGWSLALKGDDLVIGAPTYMAEGEGRAYVFRRQAGQWQRMGPIISAGLRSGIGLTAAIDNGLITIGRALDAGSGVGVNPGRNATALQAGSVSVFRLRNGAWVEEAYIKSSNPEAGDYFGAKVLVHGNTLIVAAPRESSGANGVNGSQADNTASSAGAVYVFGPDCTLLDVGVSLEGC